MKRSWNALAGVGLLASATLGSYTAAEPARLAERSYTVATVDYNGRLKQLAGNIIRLAPRVPEHFEDEAMNSVGFKIPTEGSGTISVNARTSGDSLDAGRVIGVSVHQTVPNGRSFNLSFYWQGDSWDASCVSNLSHEFGISEVGQHTAYAGSKEEFESPAVANAILGTEISAATTVVNAIANNLRGQPMPPFGNMCAFNLGGG